MLVIFSSFNTLAQEENGNVSRESALHSPTNGSRPHPSAVLSELNPGFVPSNPGTPNVTRHRTDDELDPESNDAYRPHKSMRQKKCNSHTSKGQYMFQ